MILILHLSQASQLTPSLLFTQLQTPESPAHILKQNTLGPCINWTHPSHVLTEFPSSIFLISMGYDATIKHRISPLEGTHTDQSPTPGPACDNPNNPIVCLRAFILFTSIFTCLNNQFALIHI